MDHLTFWWELGTWAERQVIRCDSPGRGAVFFGWDALVEASLRLERDKPFRAASAGRGGGTQ